MTVKNAAMLIELAVKAPGRNGETAAEHYRRMKRHREEWPVLWSAIDDLITALRAERNSPGIPKEDTLPKFVRVR